MVRCYKQISTCSICKERFVVIKDKAANIYMSSRYCQKCSDKYYPKTVAVAGTEAKQ